MKDIVFDFIRLIKSDSVEMPVGCLRDNRKRFSYYGYSFLFQNDSGWTICIVKGMRNPFPIVDSMGGG